MIPNSALRVMASSAGMCRNWRSASLERGTSPTGKSLWADSKSVILPMPLRELHSERQVSSAFKPMAELMPMPMM